MKTMILAAGLGTRLLPFTHHTPKPLFTLSGQPILDRIINHLQDAGCEEVLINTHHLHHKVEAFIGTKNYKIPVYLKHEPTILGTGGALKNVAYFFDDRPFMLINSDIVTDIDFRKVYDFHLTHNHPVTMVLHDYPEFNNVSVDSKECIIAFHTDTADNRLAFTGIHVIDPYILDFIPDGQFSGILEAYTRVISNNQCVKAFISTDHYWKDIGTAETYKHAVFDAMAPKAFQRAFGNYTKDNISRKQIQGDGSDRTWYRVSSNDMTLIAVDHGIRQNDTIAEIDAFVNIGNHLHANKISVPEIVLHDTFSGFVFLQDLGDTHLQDIISNTTSDKEIIAHYQPMIDIAGDFSLSGANGFNLSWAYQTTHYDKDLILERECGYFVEAFLQNYLNMDVRFEDLKEEFQLLSDKTLEHAVYGLMHRDMQSRNVMVKNGTYYFIDFQGARLGPVQYDIASLIIDPYVALSFSVQSKLMDVAVDTLAHQTGVGKNNFKQCLEACVITRNLQILGAFGFLSKAKNKSYFEQYIPTAVNSLNHYLSSLKEMDLPNLRSVVKKCLKGN
jgi:NDP-sugar pyrophosphorylase family protein